MKAGGHLDCTTVSAGKGPFWQQNITPDRKSFIIQSKDIIFWSNEKFLKAHDLLLFLGKKLDLILCVDHAGPDFI